MICFFGCIHDFYYFRAINGGAHLAGEYSRLYDPDGHTQARVSVQAMDLLLHGYNTRFLCTLGEICSWQK